MRRLVLLIVLSACGPRPSGPSPRPLAPAGPPAARIEAVSDDYHGTKVIDRYRWMEAGGPEVESWLRAQDGFTRRTLAALPGRAALRRAIADLSGRGDDVTGVIRLHDGALFYARQPQGADQPRQVVRASPAAAERLLVDPATRTAGGVPSEIAFFAPAVDGRHAAFGISQGGSEDAVIEILDVATARSLPERIDRGLYTYVDWLPDGKSFFYRRNQALAPGAPPTDKLRNMRVYLHRLGGDPDKDPVVFGVGTPGIEMTDQQFPVVVTAAPDSRFALATVFEGTRNEIFGCWVAPLAAVVAGAARWQRVFDLAAGVTAFAVHGDELYLLSDAGAPRGRLLVTSLAHPDAARAAVVMPESPLVLRAVAAAGDAVYVVARDGAVDRLLRQPYGRAQPAETVHLPVDGTLILGTTDPRDAGVLFSIESWLLSHRWYAYDPAARRVVDTGMQAPSPIDVSELAADEVEARSADGTMVPLSIIHRADAPKDGARAAYLWAYGAYGISASPGFLETRLAWVERGGVIGVCHARGGGERGEAWHEAGRSANKQNTFADVIACGRYLVDHGWTAPAHLGLVGKSAGGLMVARVVTLEPGLFRAAVAEVPLANPLRFETTIGGAANVFEFGTVETHEGFAALYAMDGYNHVQEGVTYPAMLVTGGLNDNRVPVWQPAKLAARLQAAAAPGRPVLLRVDFAGGHGVASTRFLDDEELADRESFLEWQLR